MTRFILTLRCLSMPLLSLLALSIAPAVHAGAPQLAITGKLTPPACSISLGSSADFQTIPRERIHAVEATRVGSRPVALLVDCTAPTKFIIKTVDNYRPSDSRLSPRLLTVIDTATREVMGHYIAHLRSTQLRGDGQPVRPLVRQTGGNWLLVESSALNAAAGLGIAFVPDGASTPVPLRSLSGNIEVELVITRRSKEFPLTDETRLAGSATVQLDYL